MSEVTTEEEMRFLLLETDLDNRDALSIIQEQNLTELLHNPFAHNIVLQIWSSSYNNSHSIASVSSVHSLLFNYNHCNYDKELDLRFYRTKDLNDIGCHGFQFQVWRFAAQSRYLVEAICVWAFVVLVHIQMYRHMMDSMDLLDRDEEIRYSIGVAQNIGGM